MSIVGGALLVNLGTPDSPEPHSVGRYLREFLMDPLVVDIPAPLRWFLVNMIIVPRRSKASSELYKKIWTDRGSPLMFHGLDLATKLSSELAMPVDLAMRYGRPSIEEVLPKILERIDQDKKLMVVPLYPQFAEATWLSTQKAVADVVKKLDVQNRVEYLGPFYANFGYISASANLVKNFLKDWPAERVLFSFHGLPVRQVKRVHPETCRNSDACCNTITDANRNCYRAQSVATARHIAREAGLGEADWSLSFQSRFGRAEWIGPSTDDVMKSYAEKGIKRLAVFCPSFVADCLETLEEIAIRGNETFREHGGEELRLIPCLNSSPEWVLALGNLVRLPEL